MDEPTGKPGADETADEANAKEPPTTGGAPESLPAPAAMEPPAEPPAEEEAGSRQEPPVPEPGPVSALAEAEIAYVPVPADGEEEQPPAVPEEAPGSDEKASAPDSTIDQLRNTIDQLTKAMAEQHAEDHGRISALRAEVQALRLRLDGDGQAPEVEGQPPPASGGAAAFVPAEGSVPAAPAAPSTDLGGLAKQAWAREQTGLASDKQSLDEEVAKTAAWRERVNALREESQSVSEDFAALASEAGKEAELLLGQLGEGANEIFQNRQEGLDLTAKMMRQRADRSETILAVEGVSDADLPAMGQEKWVEMTAAETDPNGAIQTIQKKLKEMETKRYQVISRVRNAGQKHRKSFLSFAEKHLLPVLDSIDDGEKHSEALVEALKAENPDAADYIDTWFQTYGKLRDRLLTALEKVGVLPMDVAVGGKIDYERHEPIDVEPDPELDNDSVKDTARRGYEYEGEEGSRYVLRPAQVIAAKKTTE